MPADYVTVYSLSQMANGLLTATAAGRAKMADQYVNADKLASTVAGNGLTGGAGAPLAVGAGAGLTVTADAVAVSRPVTVLHVQAHGASSSVTPATVVASLAAQANYRLINISGLVQLANVANTHAQIEFLYDDDTTATYDLTTTSTPWILLGGLVSRTDSFIASMPAAAFTALTTKGVKRVRVLTLNVGAGARTAGLVAQEVPQ